MPDVPQAPTRDRRGTTPLRIALVYFLFGCSWISLSDLALRVLDAQTTTGFMASMGKGMVFVCLSTMLVYWVARRGFREVTRANELLRAVVEGTTDAVFVKDVDGKYLLCNEAAARLVGKPVAEVLGQDDSALFDPDDARVVMQRSKQVMATGRAVTEEEELTAGGVRRSFLTTKAPYRDGAGAVVGMIGISRDMTERKQAQVALRAREARLRLFLDGVPAPIAMFDRDMRYLHVSRRWFTDLGLSECDLTGLHHYDLFPEVPERWKEIHRRCLAGAAERCDEDRFERADGTVQYFRWEVRPWMGDDGEIGGILIFSEEITALRESESRFRSVFDHAATGIGIADANGSFLQCNPAYCAILGRTEEELLETDLLGFVHPEDLAEDKALLRRLVAGEVSEYELECRFVHSSGTSKWVHKVVSALRDASGCTNQLMALVTDITDRRRSNQALRESEERYRRLVEVLPLGVFVHEDGKILFCNPGLVQLLGATGPEELLGQTSFDLTHPDDHAEIRARQLTVAQGGSVPATEIRLVRRDGRTVLVSTVATRIGGSGPSAVLVVLTDLSERERSTALLRSVLGSVTDGILTLDPLGVIHATNPATERQFGYTAAELVGSNVDLLMPEPFRSDPDHYLASYPGVAEVMGIGHEVVGQRKDGTKFPIELTVSEFRFDGMRRFTAVVRDITVRRRLEAQFQHAQKMEAVGRLAGGVAHDFNNLLTIINGYSDMILEEMPLGEQREFVMEIRGAGDRASRLTQQLLAFSRKAVVEPSIIDLNEMVSESAKLLRRLIGEDIAVTVALDPASAWVKADRGQLEQVIMNLAVNSRDAMPTGGRLSFETQVVTLGEGASPEMNTWPGVRPGRYVKLTVTDTGHGMTDEVKGKVFEPFFTTKGVGKGTGLGLAVVHGVVEQSGGHVRLDSTVGIGTTFALALPLATEVAGPATDVAKLGIRGTETILLVEDEDAVRAIARIALTTQGFTVLEAGGVADAIRWAMDQTRPIHLLVTDVVMPGLGGRQLAEAVRTHRSGLRVLYMSGYTNDALVHHGVESTDAFIQKPFTPMGLARKVRSVLDA